MKKGISLITLVITIIVVIIITGAIIISLSNTGIFSKASKATFISDIKAILEEYNVYQAFYMADGNDISSLNVDASNIHEVVTSIPNNWSYKEKIAIINGQITYLVNLKNIEDVERAKWACEVGMKANGVEGCEDIEYIEPLYKKHGGIYYNSPDLTGFNPEKTFYVTYNGDVEDSTTNISNKPPENWYDYEQKKWANIVVVNGDLKTYLVWVPRYAYKVDKEGKEVDIRFVDNDNVYIDEKGEKTIYNVKTPEFDDKENQTDFVLHSAFDVNMGTEEAPDIKRLSGFWMSKYEASELIYITLDPRMDSTGTEIMVYECKPSAFLDGYQYEFYLDEKFVAKNTSGKCTYKDLDKSTVYNVKILVKAGDILVGEYERVIKTAGVPTYNEPNAPELGNLAKKGTYYLTWGENGQEIKTEVVDGNGKVVPAPENWYNYTNKEWANIVIVNGDLETHLTWVPRYEYRVIGEESTNSSDKRIDVAFVPVTKTEVTDGYILHSAFDINMGTEEVPDIKRLSGFWMSKYEVSEVQ